MKHWVRDNPNFHGTRVSRCFTKKVMDGEVYVHERLFVGGEHTDDRYFRLDDDAGRERLAEDCISPDMLREE